ncbi:hypothetical protein [Gimesia maris]|uniref:hypothetical protein n=1 Tax=Gimesia maris TaxID=122 RepID=UPI0012B95F85|nr:hypothetical protein [Gimesia maris]
MNRKKRFHSISGFLLFGLFLLGVIAPGCGPSAKVMEAQEDAVENEYQEAIEMPENMSPEMRERRMKRVERDFGKRPEADQTESSQK